MCVPVWKKGNKKISLGNTPDVCQPLHGVMPFHKSVVNKLFLSRQNVGASNKNNYELELVSVFQAAFLSLADKVQENRLEYAYRLFFFIIQWLLCLFVCFVIKNANV